MQTRRILSAFAFTLLTIMLLLLVASRTTEAVRAENGNIDAAIDLNDPAATDPVELPGSKEEDNRAETKPDIDITSWEYILANKDNNIGHYAPHVAAIEGGAQYFDERAINALTDFLNAARNAGYTPYVQGAYRSYSSQNYIYNGKASQIAWPDYPDEADYAEAEKTVAAPGESDHQTGLAVDITDRYYSVMDAEKMNQDFLNWLRDNCAQYGFIARYPGSKVAITGLDEPWHYRYVGVTAAKYIMENNLCLEQFVAMYK